MRRHAAVLSLVALGWAGTDGLAAPLPTNNDPDRQIRFSTPAAAAERRQKLVQAIWPQGLPTSALPIVRAKVAEEDYREHLKRLKAGLHAEVDELVVEVHGMKSLIYLIHPRQAARERLAIVHEGHARRGQPLRDGIDEAAHTFLARGYSVCIAQMPLHGWNDDETLALPDPAGSGKTEVPARNHNAMFEMFERQGLPPAEALQVFLEPAVVAINHWVKATGKEDITLVGLSGGGWATHMLSAVDPRIRLSVPVAGSYPLYVRNQDAKSVGDQEQIFEPIFAEDIAEDGSGGGVCTWLEVYALGAIGAGRKQIMVTAEFDSCCFSGRHAESFQGVVRGAVRQVGEGSWDHALDSSHRSHQISPWVIEKVITRNLAN